MAYLAIFAAAIAGFGFGAAYYGWMGARWLDAVGFRPEERARIESGDKMDPTPFLLAFTAELVMAVILSITIAHFGAFTALRGGVIGITIWLGFIAPVMIVTNAYAMRSLRLTAIDAFHWLGVLVVMGVVLGALG